MTKPELNAAYVLIPKLPKAMLKALVEAHPKKVTRPELVAKFPPMTPKRVRSVISHNAKALNLVLPRFGWRVRSKWAHTGRISPTAPPPEEAVYWLEPTGGVDLG